MVQILLRLAGETDEWGLVELQGKLDTKDDAEFEGMDIGDLHFDDRGTPLLIIGHHLLSGKVVTLDRPFALMNKVPNEGASQEVDMAEESSEGSSRHGSSGPATEDASEYVITTLIRKKVIFKIRPKPIVRKKMK